jgi:hypothetical protein
VSAPVWLFDEPEILALLNAALDRFDHQPTETRSRAVLLDAHQSLPSLTRMDAAADQLWSLVQDLSRHGVLAIRPGKRGLYDADWSGAKLAFEGESEMLLREWLQRARTPSALDQWRAAVQQHVDRFPHGADVLLARRIDIAGRAPEEVVAAIARVGDISGPITLRQLSASIFWGDSKVLDERTELISALFPQLEIRERPIVVAVFLPACLRGVLFIENQDTYTAAIAGHPAASAEHALVYLAGFRSTAARIRRREGACLHFAGTLEHHSAFERWWFDDVPLAPTAYLWADLDFAGMQMLKVLRLRFDNVSAWSPGYEPMLAALRRFGGTRCSSDAQRQLDPVTTGCSYADEILLPAIREHGFLDQEMLIKEEGSG